LEDATVWQAWLDDHTAFAFVGRSGSLSVLREARSRGAGYWYAYRTHQRRTQKRYLGPSAKLTLDRLEQAAAACFVIAGRFASEGLRKWAVYSRVTGMLFLLAFIGIATGSGQSWSVLGFWAGMLVAWAWISVLAWRLLTEPTPAEC
jgi:hypothetical protein